MILTISEIKKRLHKDIIINPLTNANFNPNSIDVTLDSTLVVYTDPILDVRQENATKSITIPKEGYILRPGELYLGKTYEYTETHNLIPMLHGKSSLGRLGLFIHVTAGVGDQGFKGNWTLELAVIKPLKVYAGMKIGQLVYHVPSGLGTDTYNGKYQGDKEVGVSKSYKDFK